MGNGASNSQKNVVLKDQKTSYYMVPESPFDYLDVSEDPIDFKPFRISTLELTRLSGLSIDDEDRVIGAKKLLKAFQENQFIIVTLSDKEVC